jgi:hypothetical protein
MISSEVEKWEEASLTAAPIAAKAKLANSIQSEGIDC